MLVHALTLTVARWTHTTEAAEYVDFLRKLLVHIATEQKEGGQASCYLWKEDSEISYDPRYAEWEDGGGDSDGERGSQAASGMSSARSSGKISSSRRMQSRSARLSAGSLASPSPRMRGSRWGEPEEENNTSNGNSSVAIVSTPPPAPAVAQAFAPAPMPTTMGGAVTVRGSPRWWQGTKAFEAHSAAATRPHSPGRFFLNNGYFRRREERTTSRSLSVKPKPTVAVSRIGRPLLTSRPAAAQSAAAALTGSIGPGGGGGAGSSCTVLNMSLQTGIDTLRVNSMPHAVPFGLPKDLQKQLGRPLTSSAASHPLTQSLPLPAKPSTAPGSGFGGNRSGVSHVMGLPDIPAGTSGGAKQRLNTVNRLTSYTAATAPLSDRLAMQNEVATGRASMSLFKLGRPWSPRKSNGPPGASSLGVTRWASSRPQTGGLR